MAEDKKRVEEERIRSYISLAESRLDSARSSGASGAVVEKAERYLRDGKHYYEVGDYATALASVSYAHGLLDGCAGGVEAGAAEHSEVSLLSQIFLESLASDASSENLASSTPPARSSKALEALASKGLVEGEDGEVRLTAKGRGRIRVGLVAGVFDLIHPGHLSFLHWARGKVDVLVAVIARDPNSEVRKGREPIQSEGDRLKLVSDLKPVDIAILGHHQDPYQPVLLVRPDLMLLGKDQEADGRKIKAELARRGLRARVLRSRTWDSGELSKTTKIISRVAQVLES